MTGERPVPMTAPPRIATHEMSPDKPVKSVGTFSFLDDGNVVKIYIPLDGELAGTSTEHVTVDFSDCSVVATIQRPAAIYKFTVDRLLYPVDAGRCKMIVNKSGKLLLKLHKRNHMQTWGKLRQ